MKKIFLFLTLTMALTTMAQTVPSYPNVKLTKLTAGTLHDSVVLTNGSTKTLKYLPVSQIKVATNLTYTATPTGGTVFSSTGNDADLPLATTTNAGLQSPTDKTKIDGVQTQLDAVTSELDNLKDQINPNTYVVTDAGYSQAVNDITINAGWAWKINNVAKTNASPVVINIPVAASGYNRIDLIVLTADNTAIRVAGAEVIGTPSSPTVPVNTIQIMFLTADSYTVGTPVIPKPKNQVSQFLRNGETSYSPSEDVVYDALTAKQATLVSGATIKTINGTSVLGSGDITVSGGGGGDMVLASAQTNTGVKTFLSGTLGLRNAANTFTSFFTNANTASRNYTLPNRDGTLLDNTDLSTINTSISGKMANPSGTANYLSKFLTTTTIGPSRLWDTGTFFGIGTANTPTNDLTFGNQENRQIGIEESSNTVSGKDLSIKAGRSINYISNSNFNSLLLNNFAWKGVDVAPNSDVYAVVEGGDVYKQTGGTGSFVALTLGNKYWEDVAVCDNGDVYFVTYNQGIWKQTGGIGSVFQVQSFGLEMYGISAAPNGDVYAIALGGDIYKQTGGSGSFVGLGQTSRSWNSIDVAPNGDVFATVSNGDIYKQTGGSGSFVGLGQTSRNWKGIAVAPNGDVYATVFGGDIYKQTGGSGSFVGLGQTSSNWFNIAVAPNNNVYVASVGYNIYIQQNNGSGTANLDGGTLKIAAGTAKGTGASNWEVYTGQKTTSGTNMQTETLRLKIDNEGHITATTMPVYADNAAALAGGLTAGKFYRTSTGTLMIVY